MSGEFVDRRPRNYATAKLGMLQGRYRGELKTLLDRMTPIAFPNTPVDGMTLALFGFTAFSTGWTENTTEGNTPTQLSQPFHEVGLFQCPAGPRTGPAPNANTEAPHNAYGRLASTELVKRMLGGNSATMRPNAWKTDHASQVAVGVANLLMDERTFRNQAGMAELAGASSGWSNWRIFTMFTAFSRGPGQCAAVLRHFRTELLTAPEATRLRKLRELVVRDVERGASGIGARTGKMGAAYAVLRSDQKLQSAVALATAVGADLSLFGERYTTSAADAHIEDVITRTGHGGTVTRVADAVVETVSNVGKIIANADPEKKIIGGLVIGATIIGGVTGVVAVARST